MIGKQRYREKRGRKVRSFIAVSLTEEMKQAVGKVQYWLKSKYPEIKLVAEEQLHMTLFFLGKQTEADLRQLISKLRRDLNFENFEVSLGKVNYFHKKREDSIIYLEIDKGEEYLKELVRRLTPDVENLDYTAPKRWSAHLTIARVKKMGPEQKKRLLAQMGDEEIGRVGSFEVGEVGVWKSILSEKGAVHRLISSVSLGGRGSGSS